MKTNTPNSSKQQVITYLAAEGKSVKEISEALGMSKANVQTVLSDERVAFDIKHLRFKLHGKGVKEKFNDLLPAAQETLTSILNDDNPNVKINLKFQAAQEVFDRALGKPKQTVEVEGSLLRAVFEKLNDPRASTLDGEIVHDAIPVLANPEKKEEPENPNSASPMDEWLSKNM